MEQAVLAGGAMTTHVENAIYLGSLWILIKFLRWRSNHCRGGWILPEWRRWYNTHVRHKEPDCAKGGWYDTSSKPHRRPLPRAILFGRSNNNSHFNRRSNISSVLCKEIYKIDFDWCQLTIFPWLDPLPSSCCFHKLPTMLLRFLPTRSPPSLMLFMLFSSPPPSFPTSSCMFASRPKAPSEAWELWNYWKSEEDSLGRIVITNPWDDRSYQQV